MHLQFEHGASTSISYITHAFVHGRRLGFIPLKRAVLRRFEFIVEVVVLADRSGRRGSRVEEEVDVHVRGAVVVHGRHRTWRHIA